MRALPILAEGAGWVVVAKPPRLLVHRNRNTPRADAVLQRVRDQLGCFVYPIHRLDAAASGCLLMATERTMAGPLSLALRAGVKTYVALVRGVCRGPQSVTVDRALKDDTGRIKEAQTQLTCLASAAHPRCSLVRARPETGRYHQIRRHLRGLSHPIIGDRAHGDSHVNRWWRREGGVDRLALHCLRLELHLPDGTPLSVRCPLFSDLATPWRALPLWRAACAALPDLAATPIPLPADLTRAARAGIPSPP